MPTNRYSCLRRCTTLLTLALSGTLAASMAHAQEGTSETVPAKPAEPAEVTCIVGGDVWTVTHGVVKKGVVVMRGAKIEKVGGPETAIPAGATVVHADGKVVAPGFVADGAQLGGAVQPGNRLRDSLDPYSLSVSLAAASGVTSVYLSGTGAGGRRPGGGGGGRFGGAPAADGNFSTNNVVIKMTEGDLDAMTAAESTVTTLSLESSRGGFGGFGGRGAAAVGTSSTLSTRYNLYDQLKRAFDYARAADKYEKMGKQGTAPAKPADADAVLPLLKQERLLRVSANSVADIRYALKLSREFGIRMVISPAGEGWVIADEIASAGAMLVISARDRTMPDERRNARSGGNPDGTGILARAGVPFAVLPPDTSFSIGGEMGRDMLTFALEGSYAQRGGASAQRALESITITAARAIGMEKRLGSLDAGKDADILILSGDPLDYRSFVEQTFINGKLRYDRSRSTFFQHVKPQNGG